MAMDQLEDSKLSQFLALPSHAEVGGSVAASADKPWEMCGTRLAPSFTQRVSKGQPMRHTGISLHFYSRVVHGYSDQAHPTQGQFISICRPLFTVQRSSF